MVYHLIVLVDEFWIPVPDFKISESWENTFHRSTFQVSKACHPSVTHHCADFEFETFPFSSR